MKTAVVYLRVATAAQAESSIERQFKLCQAYAKAQGISILETYIDRNVLSLSDNRKEFQRLIYDSQQKTWDYVLVADLSRFSRYRQEWNTYTKILRENGVEVLSVIQPGTSDLLTECILSAGSQFDTMTLSDDQEEGPGDDT